MATTMSRKRKATPEEEVTVDAHPKRQKMKPAAPAMERTKTRRVRPSQSTADVPAAGKSHVKSKDTGTAIAAANTESKKRGREQSPVTTPRQKRFKDALPPTPEQTPTRGASRLLDRLNLAAPTEAARKSIKSTSNYKTPPLTPHAHKEDGSNLTLPTEIQDHVDLFAAFLNAHSLFIAHNGAGALLYLQDLLPMIARKWRKRAVTALDVRRLLGILGEEASPMEIVDDGEGRLSVDQNTPQGMSIGLQTKKLEQDFEQRLRRRWARWVESSAPKPDIAGFVASLPQAAIVRSEVAADSSRPTKGAARLDMMRATAQAAQMEQTKPIAPTSQESKTATGLASRGSSLIDRIMAKQAHASTLPSGPTQAQIDRLTALDRIEEVALVLDMLAGGRPRASFSMQSLVQHLQGSMRNPIAREEAERVVGLLAGEVAPRFVNVIRSGTLHGVVITKLGRPVVSELRRRVEEARGRE